jgi:enamine deaminase RidA (YjgF/YER057c/UK114 family)
MSDLRKPINPKTLPIVPFYSQGMEVAGAKRMLFVSGQVGMRPDGTPGDGIEEQAQLAVANLRAVLAEAGMTSANIVKNTIYLTDASLFEGFAKAAGASLPSPPPATTLLIVKALASPALLVEIEAIAVV